MGTEVCSLDRFVSIIFCAAFTMPTVCDEACSFCVSVLVHVSCSPVMSGLFGSP